MNPAEKANTTILDMIQAQTETVMRAFTEGHAAGFRSGHKAGYNQGMEEAERMLQGTPREKTDER